MIEAILRRISIGFVITTMLSELLEERTRVFDRFDSCGPTRGSEEGGMIDQWGGRAERGLFICGLVETPRPFPSSKGSQVKRGRSEGRVAGTLAVLCSSGAATRFSWGPCGKR
jgi:hypothetical protein